MLLTDGSREGTPMRHALKLALAALTGLMLMISGLAAAPAHAYGGNGSVGVYQVGLSFNCNKGDCGGSYGGFWGWWQFNSPTNDPNAGTSGNGEATGCSHGGGFNGAGHSVYAIGDWYVATDPSMGIPVFFASWTETDTFRGQSQTYPVTNQSTGIPAFTVHRPLLELFGIPTPPGQSMNVQVSWKPAH
jgi:hypothetical protein